MLPVVKCRSRAGRHSHRKKTTRTGRCKVSGGGLFHIVLFTHSYRALCGEDYNEQLAAFMTHFTEHKNMSKIRLWTGIRLLRMERQKRQPHLQLLCYVRLCFCFKNWLLRKTLLNASHMLSRPPQSGRGGQASWQATPTEQLILYA